MKIVGKHGSIEVSRPSSRVLLVTYAGHDVGEFDDAPFVEMDRQLGDGELHLFVDGRESKGASVDVSSAWARWLAERRDRLLSVHMLSESRVIQISGNFVKRFAAVGEKMRVHTTYEPFEHALDLALREGGAPAGGR